MTCTVCAAQGIEVEGSASRRASNGALTRGRASRKTRLPGTSDNMVRVGRKAAGRLLDGRTWNQMPEVGA